MRLVDTRLRLRVPVVAQETPALVVAVERASRVVDPAVAQESPVVVLVASRAVRVAVSVQWGFPARVRVRLMRATVVIRERIPSRAVLATRRTRRGAGPRRIVATRVVVAIRTVALLAGERC